ncbi:MAG TPA: DUF4962 domain-containing protein [Terriglobales bacterium]|nr:DUF4962 domain-containing protein [Terriglobales bacterium]
MLSAPARTLLVLIVCCISTASQDARENLGPKDEPAKSTQPHPLAALMQSVTWQLKPELRGVHPRVYVTAAELEQLRGRARGSHRELWQRALRNLPALTETPPPPPAEERRAQNTAGISMAGAAFAYAIERDPKYLAAARKYMDAATSYDVWGYSYNKPNVDLAAGHLLYALGWSYDLLYNELTPAERERYRAKLVRQGQQLYEYYKPKPGRTYSYSQNHVFIPMAGLAVAAYALEGEAPEADHWARLSAAIYDRVLATYSPDGYYYEGMEYWIFSTPWIVHYLDAHAHATGEDLYARAPGLALAHLYAAHSMLPGGNDAFDFGDVFFGPLSRTGKDEDRKRTHPGGHFNTNYNILYRLAARFRDEGAQGVAAWLAGMGQVNAEDFWSLAWYDASLPATPIEKLEPWHYFKDHEVAYWRSDWSPRATAIAFKCGPPEGHHTAALVQQFPDWRLEAGHAHPDANHFIVFADGKYLTGDSGYAGVPMTEQHNTVLVDGKGQANEGEGHSAWQDFPYSQLDRIRMAEVDFGPDRFFVRGDATAAYATSLGVRRFERSLMLTARGFVMWDTLETAQARTFTSVLHSDDKANARGSEIELGSGSGARLDVRVLSPEKISAQVEPNWMIAPGRPGSVASGQREARGERVRISNATPAKDVQFVYDFTIRNTTESSRFAGGQSQ